MSSAPVKRNHAPRRLARLVPDAVAGAMKRHGFAHGDILKRWADIVGPELAACAMPERIRWPRRGEDDGDGRKRAGTLVIRVAGPMAIEIQHMSPQIIERVNGFYGYFAIGAVKLVQGPLPRAKAPAKPARRPLDADAAATLDTATAPVGDEALRTALSRLGKGILTR